MSGMCLYHEVQYGRPFPNCKECQEAGDDGA